MNMHQRLGFPGPLTATLPLLRVNFRLGMPKEGKCFMERELEGTDISGAQWTEAEHASSPP